MRRDLKPYPFQDPYVRDIPIQGVGVLVIKDKRDGYIQDVAYKDTSPWHGYKVRIVPESERPKVESKLVENLKKDFTHCPIIELSFRD